MEFQVKEVTLVPSFTYGHHHGACEFEEAAGYSVAIPDLPEATITHHFDLDDAAEAFRVAADREFGTPSRWCPPVTVLPGPDR